MGGWCASAAGLASICLLPRSASPTPSGPEEIVDTIGVVKVHLVRRVSAKRVVRHFGVVFFDVEIDQLLELAEAFERMQIEPLMARERQKVSIMELLKLTST